MRAANQAVVVRCAVEHSTIHRYWRVWASVASLLLREAGGSLLQLELSKQQQRSVHTRLQAELAGEVALSRVENIEARTLLAKSQALEQLRPGHELATDKELLREQSRALQAAHESAAAAHLAAAAHRVGEQALTRDLRDQEAAVQDMVHTATYGKGQMALRSPPRSPAGPDPAELAALQDQNTTYMGMLRRTGVEMRVLVRSLQALETEAASTPPPSAPKASGASPGPKPRTASPAGDRMGDRPAGRPPKAPGRGRGR